jgi:hypothetical protein
MSAFEPPPLADEVELAAPPVLAPGAMVHSRPYVAAPAHNQALGFPGDRVPDWEQRAVDKLAGNCPGGRTGPTTGGRLTLQRNSSVAAGSMRIADQL